MDVLNKFCSSVSSTVSQLSAVLPGNPVTREYEATQHIASAGPGLVWKIYSGYKKSTRQEAAIFVFEKRQLERGGDRELLLESLRRGISQLTRLRHPQILVVHHQLEESRDCLAFATEPVFASLANILGSTENMPTPSSKHKLFDIEIKYGLLQVGEGLAFLHKDAKMLHQNLCPESIVINQQGAWKIFGLDFCVHNTSVDSTPAWSRLEYRKSGPPMACPDLDYLAPECGLMERLTPASDVYSLGALVYTLYNQGEPLFANSRDWHLYSRNMAELKKLPASRLQCVAPGLRDLVGLMLNATPELRPDEHDFIKADFFEDVCVKALNYLDSLFQWDNRQKSQFYKGLPQITENLPHRVCLNRVIPCLVKEFVNPVMVPFVLPNVLAIAENCSNAEFTQHILPHIKPVMKMSDPIQILLIFMQRMDLLLKLTPCEEVKSDVLPMLYRALESEAQEIQELCLSVLPTFAALIEYPAMKNALLPRIKRLCVSTSFISVRVNCLVCVGKLLEHLDKWLVLDEVLPFLPQIPSREPAVLMGILGIYKLVLSHKKMNISKEVMAGKILPFLMPLSIESTLTLNQFNAIITVIKDMVGRVETEHRAKLEQLHAIHQEQNSMDVGLTPPSAVKSPASSSTQSDFEQLLGMKPSAPSQNNTMPATRVNNDILSFQDKQRLVKEWDAATRLQNEPLLSPLPVPAKAPPATTVDLTASLMANNLSQMSLPKPPLGGSTWQQPVATQWHAWPSNGIASPPQRWPHQWPAVTQAANTTGKVAMNAMPTTSNMQVPLFSSQPMVKPLSSTDINDLLS